MVSGHYSRLPVKDLSNQFGLMPPLTFTLHKKIKFCKIFFSKCDQISFLQIWSHLLKKSLMKNLYFFALSDVMKTKLCVSDKTILIKIMKFIYSEFYFEAFCNI